MFARISASEPTIRIERFPGISQDDTEALLTSKLGHILGTEFASRAVWTENSSLRGGVRVFLDDELYDFSYESVRQRFMK